MTNKNLISGFGLKLPDKEEVKLRLKKVKEEKKVTKRSLTSAKLSLTEKLQIISEEVNRRLGKYQYNTQVIYDIKELEEYITSSIKNEVISIDTETNNSVDPITCKIMGLCIYSPGLKQAYVPVNHIDNETGERLSNQITEQQIGNQLKRLKEANTKIIMHNAKFDIQVLDFTCMNEECNSISCY